MKEKKRYIWHSALFILLIAGLFIIYDYPDTLLKRPQSVHNWRQCDGASIALNYYQQGMKFFKPQTHMLYSDGFTTGYTAPSEIPILYYFVAILYNLFGYQEYIFRMVNLIFFLTGLFFLFRLAERILKNVWYSLFVTILVFTSPVLVYYGNNFLPNTVALSFSFIGWYFFYRYYQNHTNKSFYSAVLFFGIAGALKVTELMGPLIILMLLTSDRLKLINLGITSAKKYPLQLASILTIFIVIAAWVLYARYYNNLHGSHQFMTYALPFWEMSKDAITFNLHKMNVLWFKEYFFPATFYFMLICLVVTIIFRKLSDKVLFYSSVAYTLGFFAYVLLWFQSLGDHDYFLIAFYILPAFVFINFIFILRNWGSKKSHAFILYGVMLLYISLNVLHAQKRHSLRYEGSWMNDYQQVKDLYTIEPWLKTKGIGSTDTIIFYPSMYIRPLYLMNLKGWVIADRTEATPEMEKNDSLQMAEFSMNGARYFITMDLASALQYRPFKPYRNNFYARYNNIYIYKIPDLNTQPKIH